MKVPQSEQEKPLVVLVLQESFLRLWMERSLSEGFRVCAFSTSEDALAFIGSTFAVDVLIADLDLGLSPLGGCNIARDVRHRFPLALVFVFSNRTEDDYRIALLRGMRGVRMMSWPLDAFFMSRRVKTALRERF